VLNNTILNFNTTDVLVLQSIKNSEGAKGASIGSIISFADYVNHAILTYAELRCALEKLLGCKIIEQHGEFIRTNNVFLSWYKKKFKGKNPSLDKEFNEMKIYLTGIKEIRLEVCKYSEIYFEECVKQYLSK